MRSVLFCGFFSLGLVLAGPMTAVTPLCACLMSGSRRRDCWPRTPDTIRCKRASHTASATDCDSSLPTRSPNRSMMVREAAPASSPKSLAMSPICHRASALGFRPHPSRRSEFRIRNTEIRLRAQPYLVWQANFRRWEISGLGIIQSGTPFSITDSGGVSLYGTANSRANWASGATLGDRATLRIHREPSEPILQHCGVRKGRKLLRQCRPQRDARAESTERGLRD